MKFFIIIIIIDMGVITDILKKNIYSQLIYCHYFLLP